ncbi:MAG: CHASE4 domain-containing protein, partial [Allorhizobium sp.]
MRLHHFDRRLRPLATRRVAVAVLLVVFATLAMMVASIVMTALDRVASYANHLDEERSRETLVGAVQTFEHQLGATLLDYTAWDDAATNAYVHKDMAWMISNFGDMTFDSDLFDVAIVLDAEGRPMMAYSDGQPVEGDASGYLTPALMGLFDKVRSGESGLTPQALGFIRTQKGIGSAGVALIRSKSGEIGAPPTDWVYLAFIRHLSPLTVKRLSEAYVLPGLVLVPPSSSNASVTISAPSGQAIASLAWFPRAPGDQSREQVAPLIKAALVIV